ncbi:MAG: hypothetical protein MJK13_19020 [Pseudomonadales bacterium]|nr:hypothetical protein [Pseudomonadales bacterium]
MQSASTKQEFLLSDFKILLYKRRARKISVFVLMSENSSLKIEYFKNMQKLFELFSKQVPMCKKPLGGSVYNHFRLAVSQAQCCAAV